MSFALAQHLEDIAWETLGDDWQHWPKTVEGETYDLVDPDEFGDEAELYRDMILVKRKSDDLIFEVDVYVSISDFQRQTPRTPPVTDVVHEL